MDIYEETRDGYLMSSDPHLLDLKRVHEWLSMEAFWALSRTVEVVEESITNSLSLGIYNSEKRQVAFCRLVTDRATFAWLCDVFVEESARGQGLGTWLAQSSVNQLRSMGVYRMILATKDAHEVYRKAGFQPLSEPCNWMILDTKTRTS